ncbi:hypothetical protein PBI_DEWDROP_97 [Microbacterium phage Dewdrop]|nr:hypothetical protein PBI_LEAF_97 [Microbacterium phage Leaf]QGZ17465.1 hypothetical protein PBI_DEWDROP_97 [Microbacterium phage Dewdrop]
MATRSKTTPHSVRLRESLWVAAKRRADGENVTMAFMVNEIMDGYARGFLNLPKTDTAKSTEKREPNHSIRASDELWKKARSRASDEGLTMNDVVEKILSGYARGLLDMPKMTKTFISQKKAS